MLKVPATFDRGAYRDEERSLASAVWLLEDMCDVLGVPDLGETDVLDVGCGVKFSQALLNRGLPIRSYTGVDVYEELITFLQQNVADDRFEYHHISVHNELYNPDAPPMTVDTDFGVGTRRFDLICLFSVFTHLAPHDYVTMLQLLRRYARPNTRLIFTLYVDELTAGGYGLIDRIARQMYEAATGRRVVGAGDMAELARANAARPVVPFVDLDPERPLQLALYSREYAYGLFEGTGWTPLELRPPNEFAHHHFVCVPSSG